MLINVTGDGKGKSTSAFGTVVRALGWGWQVTLLQFVKGELETGEVRFFRNLRQDNFVFEQLGAGLSWHPGNHKELAQSGWLKAMKLLHDPNLQLLVLDELNIALHLGYLDMDEVVNALAHRRKDLHVMVTGRYAHEKLLAISDLISDIHALKHPFEQGEEAQKGIDY
jgi:cob(I)alamin adenosyltransferase